MEQQKKKNPSDDGPMGFSYVLRCTTGQQSPAEYYILFTSFVKRETFLAALFLW